MAKRRKGGHRAPKDYDPRRGKRTGSRAPGRRSSPDSSSRASRPSPASSTSPSSLKPSAAQAPKVDPAKTLADAQARVRPPGAKLDARLTHTDAADGTTFAELGLGPNLVRTLGELGAATPFPVQVATIPDMLAGHDLLGRARTGSGKTIAFGAAIVERLLLLKAAGAFGAGPTRESPRKRGVRDVKTSEGRNPKAVILAPTRELALQIDATVQPLARSVGFYTAQLVGGVPLDPQVHALERGIDIVIGTPGRMQDLINRRKLDLREAVIAVVDEADHMCDLGFLEPTQRLLRSTVRGGQRILFSATLDDAVSSLIDEFLRDARSHEVVDARDATDIEHRVFIVLREHKDEVLREVVESQQRRSRRTMVFCRTRAAATRVAEMLVQQGIVAVPLHGDLSQSRRERNLERFSTGKAHVLVATDIAARGIHVDRVDLVLQADPPDDAKTYLHRAGRTGRAGESGLAVTLIPRTRQRRTRELLAEAGIEPTVFDDMAPGDDPGI